MTLTTRTISIEDDIWRVFVGWAKEENGMRPQDLMARVLTDAANQRLGVRGETIHFFGNQEGVPVLITAEITVSGQLRVQNIGGAEML
jgi:hypothetical protein